MDQSRATLKVTNQRVKISVVILLSRRYKSDRHYIVKKLDGNFDTNSLCADVKSVSIKFSDQIYSHKCGFSDYYPMSRVNGERVVISLTDFISKFGVPSHLTFDGAQVQVSRNITFMTDIIRCEVK